MNRPLKKYLPLALLLPTALLVFLAEGLGLRDLAGQLLIAACGGFFIKRGVDQVQTRVAAGYGGALSRGTRTYTGRAAVARGVMQVLGGSAILSVALYFAMGREEAVLEFVKAHPGPALLFAGSFLASWSLSTTIGPEEARPRRSLPRFLLSFPMRIFALALLAAALALIVAGVADIAAPGALRVLLARLAALAGRGF